MDNEPEPEVIRQQMDETRTALTEKIEKLEQQVIGTVQEATTAVAETVGTVKEAVQDTVASVKETVSETVETVKETFDLPRQVEKRPWTMMLGSAALGFLGGYLLGGGREQRSRERVAGGPHYGQARSGREEYYASRSTGNGNGYGATTTTSAPATSSSPARQEEPGLLDSLGTTFQSELSQLKGLAVGAMGGLLRDMLTRAVPEPMQHQVGDLLDNLTTKLGGQPVRGPLLPEETAHAESSPHTGSGTESCSQRFPAGAGEGV